MTSRKWKSPTILIVSTGVNGQKFSYGRRLLLMGQYENRGTIVSKVRNLTNHEKSEKQQELALVQGQARLNFNIEDNFSDIVAN